MPPPKSSATSVAMQASTTLKPRNAATGFGKYSLMFTASDFPVAIPSLAAMCWMRISIKVPRVTTQRSS